MSSTMITVGTGVNTATWDPFNNHTELGGAPLITAVLHSDRTTEAAAQFMVDTAIKLTEKDTQVLHVTTANAMGALGEVDITKSFSLVLLPLQKSENPWGIDPINRVALSVAFSELVPDLIRFAQSSDGKKVIFLDGVLTNLLSEGGIAAKMMQELVTVLACSNTALVVSAQKYGELRYLHSNYPAGVIVFGMDGTDLGLASHALHIGDQEQVWEEAAGLVSALGDTDCIIFDRKRNDERFKSVTL